MTKMWMAQVAVAHEVKPGVAAQQSQNHLKFRSGMVSLAHIHACAYDTLLKEYISQKRCLVRKALL